MTSHHEPVDSGTTSLAPLPQTTLANANANIHNHGHSLPLTPHMTPHMTPLTSTSTSSAGGPRRLSSDALALASQTVDIFRMLQPAMPKEQYIQLVSDMASNFCANVNRIQGRELGLPV